MSITGWSAVVGSCEMLLLDLGLGLAISLGLDLGSGLGILLGLGLGLGIVLGNREDIILAEILIEIIQSTNPDFGVHSVYTLLDLLLDLGLFLHGLAIGSASTSPIFPVITELGIDGALASHLTIEGAVTCFMTEHTTAATLNVGERFNLLGQSVDAIPRKELASILIILNELYFTGPVLLHTLETCFEDSLADEIFLLFIEDLVEVFVVDEGDKAFFDLGDGNH